MNLINSVSAWTTRLYDANYSQFGTHLKYFLNNIESNPLLSSILTEACKNYPVDQEALDKILQELNRTRYNFFEFANEENHCAFSYQVLKEIIKTTEGYNIVNLVIFAAPTHYEVRDRIFESYITPIINHFNDCISESNSTLYLLDKYKKRVEWFTAEELKTKYQNLDSNYEQLFEDDLRLFLFDHGIEYPFSTPKSPSGRADVIGSIDDKDPLIVEIKLIDKTRNYGVERIKTGLTQIISYTSDYNKNFGFLVIFNLDQSEINFDFKNQENETFPVLNYNNRAYYFVVINLFQDISASKRGAPKILNITEGDLIK